MNVMQMDAPRAASSMLAMGTKVNNFPPQPDSVACATGDMDGGSYTPAPAENGVLQDGVDSSLLTSMQFPGDMSSFGGDHQGVADAAMGAGGFRQQAFYGAGFPQPQQPGVGRPMYANKSPKPSPMQAGFGTPRYATPNSAVHSGSPTPTLNQLLTQGQQKFSMPPEFADYGPGPGGGKPQPPPAGGQFESPAMWAGSQQPQQPPQQQQQQQQQQRMDIYSPAGVPLGGQMPGFDMRRGPPLGMPPSYGPVGQYAGNGMSPFGAGGGPPRHMPGGQPHGYTSQDMLVDSSGQDLVMDDRMTGGDGRGPLSGMPGLMHHGQLPPGMGPHGMRPMQPMSSMMTGHMMPPPSAASLSGMYGKPMPMGGGSPQFPGSLPPPMMAGGGYGQQMPPGAFCHASSGPQPPMMGGYMQYPFDQMSPAGNAMFGQPGMHPRPNLPMGDPMQPRKIMPNSSNGLPAESHKVPPASKQKQRKDGGSSGGGSSSKTAAAKPIAPSPSPSDSSSCSGLDRPGTAASTQGYDAGMDGGASGMMGWPAAVGGTPMAGAGSGAPASVGAPMAAAPPPQSSSGGSGGLHVISSSNECITKLYSMGQEPERKPFLDRLIALMEEKGTPISTMPLMAKQPLDLYQFYLAVKERGGFELVSKKKGWKEIGNGIHIGASTYAAFTLKKAYLTYLLAYECKYDRNGRDPQIIISAMEAKNANAKKNSLRKKMAAAAAAAAAAAGSGGSGSAPAAADAEGRPGQPDGSGGPSAATSFRPPSVQSALGATATGEGTFSPALSAGRDDSCSMASSHGSDLGPAGSGQAAGAAFAQQLPILPLPPGSAAGLPPLPGGGGDGSLGAVGASGLALSSGQRPASAAVADAGSASGSSSVGAGSGSSDAAIAPGSYPHSAATLAADASGATTTSAQDGAAAADAAAVAGGESSASGSSAQQQQQLLLPPSQEQQQQHRPPSQAPTPSVGSEAMNGYGRPSGWQPQQQLTFLDSNSMDEALSNLAAFGEQPPSTQQQQQQSPYCMPNAARQLSLPPQQQQSPAPAGFGQQQQLLRGSGMMSAMRAPQQQQQQGMFGGGQQHPPHGMLPPGHQRDGFLPGSAQSPRPPPMGMLPMGVGSPATSAAAGSYASSSADPSDAALCGGPPGGGRYPPGSSAVQQQFAPWGYGAGGAMMEPGFHHMQQQQQQHQHMSGRAPVGGGCEGWNGQSDQPKSGASYQQHAPPPPPFGAPPGGSQQQYDFMLPGGSQQQQQQQPYDFMPPTSVGMMAMSDGTSGMQSVSDVGAHPQQQQQQPWQTQLQQRFGSDGSNMRNMPMPPSYPAAPMPLGAMTAGGGMPLPVPRMPSCPPPAPTPPQQAPSPLTESRSSGPHGSGSATPKPSSSRSGSKSKSAAAEAASASSSAAAAAAAVAAAAAASPPDVVALPPPREYIPPPGCTEAVQPKPARRRKVLTLKEVGHVDPSRIIMSLKCGLLAESTWALDVLNILLHDDAAVGYFSLSRHPSLLDTVLQHYIQSLSDMFPEFDLSSCGVPSQSRAAVRAREHFLASGAQFSDENADDSSAAEDIATTDHRRAVRCSRADYTWKTRTGLMVRVDDRCPANGLKRLLQQQQPDHAASLPSGAGECGCAGRRLAIGGECAATPALVSVRANAAASHIVTQSRPGQLQSGLARRLFYGSGDDVAREPLPSPDAIDKPPQPLLRDLGCDADEKNQKPSVLAKVDSTSAATTGVAGCGSDAAANSSKRRRVRAYDDDELDELCASEPFVRDELLLSLADDDQEAVAARCLCASNIVRSMSFVPGNERHLCSSPLLVAALGALLRLQCRDGERGGGGSGACDDDDPGDAVGAAAEDRTSLWRWPYLDELREDALVTMSNISGHLDLGAFEEDVCRPLLEALLHWATSAAAYARDPFAAAATTAGPTAGGVLPTPQTLSIEAICKICIHPGNVDLLLATPPWRRLLRLFGELVRLVAETREPALRELAIVLASGLVQAESGVARALVAHEPHCINLLLTFLETAEQSAMHAMHLQGVAALRENPELMGTSPEMVRRVAGMLFVLSQVPDNRPLFRQQQSRLLSLVMSPIFDQSVAWSVSGVLYECSRP